MQEEGFQPEKLTPEILESVRQQFSEDEIAAALRDLRKAGFLELRDFIQELEQLAAPRQ